VKLKGFDSEFGSHWGKVRKMFGKVLVVEDDDDLAGLLTARLRKAGFTVERAGNGEAGVRLTRDFAPDVVLMDWMMPVKSGIEATEEIRDDPWITQPYIAMISVRSGEDDLARAELAGVDEYITKPFSPHDVLDRVSAIIELRTWLSRDSAENAALAVSEVCG
jgi:DNA-binding response OmpR family regulator